VGADAGHQPEPLSRAGYPLWRRTISPEAPLCWSIDDLISPRIFSALLAYEPVALDAQAINFGQHSLQQLFRGLCRDARPLKGTDFLPLPKDLAAHVLDFASDSI
jgi:hypothetical protein